MADYTSSSYNCGSNSSLNLSGAIYANQNRGQTSFSDYLKEHFNDPDIQALYRRYNEQQANSANIQHWEGAAIPVINPHSDYKKKHTSAPNAQHKKHDQPLGNPKQKTGEQHHTDRSLTSAPQNKSNQNSPDVQKPAPESAARAIPSSPPNAAPQAPKPHSPENTNRATQKEPDKPEKHWHFPVASDLYEYGQRYIDEQKRNVDYLEKELGQYVDNGGSPILAAFGATVLDIGVMAMETTWGFTDPILNLGTGLGKGGYEGVKEDVQRVLSIIPASKTIGKVAKAADAFFYATDLYHGVKNKDSSAVLNTLGSIGMAGLMHYGHKKIKSPFSRKNAISNATSSSRYPGRYDLRSAKSYVGDKEQYVAVLAEASAKQAKIKDLISFVRAVKKLDRKYGTVTEIIFNQEDRVEKLIAGGGHSYYKGEAGSMKKEIMISHSAKIPAEVGVLMDEYLHAWNSAKGRTNTLHYVVNGQYASRKTLNNPAKAHAIDVTYHKLELLHFLRSGEELPQFMRSSGSRQELENYAKSYHSDYQRYESL